uniref:C-type lectin domain-containing protein n=1 Tax=Oryzias latipes TaxID=8090 RepID=A0A3P9KLR1_ORYLA
MGVPQRKTSYCCADARLGFSVVSAASSQVQTSSALRHDRNQTERPAADLRSVAVQIHLRPPSCGPGSASSPPSLSGCLQVCDLQPDLLVRRFRYVGLQKTWSEAQTYCRETFKDLATIQNLNNNTEAQQAGGRSQFWIGLFNGTWRWSQEEERDSNPSTWFKNWNAGEPGSGSCVSINKAGMWFAKDCSALNAFVCFNAETGQHVLVDQQKSWLDAQAHCRSLHTDLSSIRSLAENAQVSAVLPAQTQMNIGSLFSNLLGGSYSTSTSTSPTSAWIGLHRSLWAWSDGSSAAFRQFGLVQSNGRDDCVLMDSSSSTWFWRPCTEYHPFLCNTGEPRVLIGTRCCRSDPVFLFARRRQTHNDAHDEGPDEFGVGGPWRSCGAELGVGAGQVLRKTC